MLINCFKCGKQFYRDKRYVNENIKLDYHNYCSSRCLSKSRINRRFLICNNPACLKEFERPLGNISNNNYCCRSCAVSVNNNIYPKRKGVIKYCGICQMKFKRNKTFCSTKCKSIGQKIDGNLLIWEIKKFYKDHNRIPFKKELKHYRSVRSHFGTWNNAVVKAGFKPNPIMFASKHIANDGHKCDSLSERIIDDWLYSRRIKHMINVPYPGNDKLTVDFKVGDFWIEFFGLSGEHKRYDELKEKKLSLSRRMGLKLIEVYPKHLFPENKLNKVLEVLMNLKELGKVVVVSAYPNSVV